MKGISFIIGLVSYLIFGIIANCYLAESIRFYRTGELNFLDFLWGWIFLVCYLLQAIAAFVSLIKPVNFRILISPGLILVIIFYFLCSIEYFHVSMNFDSAGVSFQLLVFLAFSLYFAFLLRRKDAENGKRLSGH